jgi:hypothetical protein
MLEFDMFIRVMIPANTSNSENSTSWLGSKRYSINLYKLDGRLSLKRILFEMDGRPEEFER